ncbi:MAG TPA: glycosyltransferase family 9 protein [Chthoniobacteraceae bacterium]|jgi:ADP-heptose:LPS heptosyltransferase
MRILALQLKRIGDLVLTTPALALLRRTFPEAYLALAVNEGCAPLLGAIGDVDTSAVFGRGRGFAPWQQMMTGPWDLCLDFTGTDRSALASVLSRAKQRATFEWVRKNRFQALAYHRFIDSSVRERHTVDHYLDLVNGVLPQAKQPAETGPRLILPETAIRGAAESLEQSGIREPFVLLHPGTARPEKFWQAERWAEVARTLFDRWGLRSILTGGNAPPETTHCAQISSAGVPGLVDFSGKLDLLALAALVSRARLVISCDTAIVHLAAAFRRPQVALFGPTNPFHWRPRHPHTVILSAASPAEALTDFSSRMKGAPMERISTDLVISATNTLLAASAS